MYNDIRKPLYTDKASLSIERFGNTQDAQQKCPDSNQSIVTDA